MATYTITLFELASTFTSGTVNQRADALEAWLFQEDYGILDSYKYQFQHNFIQHYLFTEIGFETPELFRIRLTARLQEITPYYNTMYELFAKLQEWDFMEDDINYSEESIGEEKEKAKTDINETNDSNQNENSTRNIDSHNHSDSNNNGTYNKNETTINSFNATDEHTGSDTMTHTHNLTVTGTKKGNNFQITNANGAVSDYPQGNVNLNMDYYTSGNVNSNKQQDTIDEGEKQVTTGTITDDHVYNNDLITKNGSSTDTVQGINTEQKIDNTDVWEKVTDGNQIINELKNILHRVDELERNRNNTINIKKWGRLQRRQIPEIIKEIREQYRNIVADMIEECGDLFMSIW